MAVMGLKKGMLWLVAFASTASAQMDEYTTALRSFKTAGDTAVADQIERLLSRHPQFIQAYRALNAISRRAGVPERSERRFTSLLESPETKPYGHFGLAAYYNTRGQYARAEHHAMECLRLLPAFVPAYGELAKAARDSAVRTRVFLFIEEKIRTQARAAGPHYAKGLIHSDLGAWTEAIPALARADELEPDTWEILDALYFAYYRTDQSANIRRVLERALAAVRHAHNLEREGMILGRIGMVELDLGEYDQAETNLERAVAIMQDLGWAQLELAYQSNLGATLMNTGRYAEALRHVEEALALSRRTGSRLDEGRNIGLIANVYMESADYAAAIRAFTEAAGVAREVGDTRSEADQVASLGLIYSTLGDHEKALQFARKALRIARTARNPWMEGRFLLEGRLLEVIGFIHSGRRDNVRALAAFRQGLAIARRSGDQLGEASRLAYASEAQASLGRYGPAVTGLKRALELARRIRAFSIEGRILNDHGKVQAALGRLEGAIESHKAALDAGERAGLPEVIWRAHAGTALALERLKRKRDAAKSYTRAIEALERIRSRLPLPEDKMGFFESKTAVYSNYIRLLIAMKKDEPGAGFEADAFHIAERSRARSLLEMSSEAWLGKDSASEPARSSLVRAESRIGQLQRELAREYARGDSAKLVNLRAALVEAEDQHLSLRRVSKQEQTLSVRLPEPILAAQAQGMLDAKSALLVYATGVDVSHVFVVTGEKLAVLPLPGSAELGQRVGALRAVVSSRPTIASAQPYIHHARALYRTLIEPATRLLRGKTELLIAPDGPLYYLPFGLLLTAEPSAGEPVNYRTLQYLMRERRISMIPSASVLAALRERPAPADRSGAAFVLGDAAYANSFARLLHSRNEAESIGRLYEPAQSRILVGRNATEEHIKNERRLGDYEVIHFAVHGRLNETRPQYSALVLSVPDAGTQEDGFLYAYEISRLNIRAGLVGLSACSTALGRNAGGEGLIGLAHAFLGAGAHSVLASLWPVDDRSTAALMTQFYRMVRLAGATKAEALRQAQLRSISSLQSAHPYYWAGFSIFGDSR